MYVQYGCGICAPEGWRNFDASPSLILQRILVVGRLLKNDIVEFPETVEFGDIVKGLPVADRSCAGVYCSHVLEHLALADLRIALRETLRVLRPGGIFRLVVPDLESMARQYIEADRDAAAIDFLRSTLLGKEVRARSIRAFVREWFGNSYHLWMWDYRSLAAELRSAGFSDVRRAQVGDCGDDMFKVVEDESRWAGCLGIECRRPIS